MKKTTYFLLFLIVLQSVTAQSPKREMRATWLTTVWRLDWPSVTVPSATGTNDAARQAAIQQQKNDLIKILDGLKAANMNTAFMQVRSMCDAMYQSSYEPWSQFISSERGANPGYDPLAFAIVEAHKRGIELHAWLNPYRYSSSQTTHGETAMDYYNTHRDWLLAYDSYAKILNPGMPEVVLQIKKVIGEIVNNYDVDGIVFDDYFYAYGGTSATLDAAAQTLYKPANKDLGDWRRENVNKMIAAVYDTIQKVKPYITFGVSPFGTWTTDATVAAKRGVPLPTGVGTTGNMYAEIYCDPVAWLEEGTVDYVSPQLYWTTYSAYPYGKLAPWWSNVSNRFGKHFYASHSISSLSSASPAPTKVVSLENEVVKSLSLSTLEMASANQKTLSKSMRAPTATNFTGSEVLLQIESNRTSDINDAPGSVFYATDKLVNTAGFPAYLVQNKFTQQSICPAIGWKKTVDQSLVENLNVSGQTLTWTYLGSNVMFAVYAFPNANRNDAGVFASSKYLLGIAYNKQFSLPVTVNSTTHKIAVSVVDRYKNEFAARVYGETTATSIAANLTFPAANAKALIPCVFKWDAVSGADSYVWQVARNAQFTDLVCSRETVLPQFFSGLQTNLKDNTDYYWRVRTRKANAVDVWSASRKFTSDKFGIVSPANNASNISLTPTISWDYVSASASYTVEISSAADFSVAKQVFKQTTSNTSVVLTAGTLLSSTNYYVRVSVSDGIVQSTSEIVVFTTQDTFIPVPQLTKPTTGANITGTSIEVCWAQQASNGFRAEISKDPTFPARGTTLKTVDSNTSCITFDALTAATYYVRVRALTSSGVTEPSTTATVVLTDNTALTESYLADLKCFIRTNGIGNNNLIVVSNESFEGSIFLSTLTGSAVLLQKDINIVAGENSIKLNNLSQGAYILTIKSNTKTVSYKIIN
ncbi:MAG: family 10 glycosylhydrolase [Paludibacter sp.]